jgi:hypothetical protein
MRQHQEPRRRPSADDEDGGATSSGGGASRPRPARPLRPKFVYPSARKGKRLVRRSGRPCMVTPETECEIAYAVRSLRWSQRTTAAYFYLSHSEIGRILENEALDEQPFEGGAQHRQAIRRRYAAAVGKRTSELFPEEEARPHQRLAEAVGSSPAATDSGVAP